MVTALGYVAPSRLAENLYAYRGNHVLPQRPNISPTIHDVTSQKTANFTVSSTLQDVHLEQQNGFKIKPSLIADNNRDEVTSELI
jgi:hypothetical protein